MEGHLPAYPPLYSEERLQDAAEELARMQAAVAGCKPVLAEPERHNQAADSPVPDAGILLAVHLGYLTSCRGAAGCRR